jgi:phosphohistidine phosphatase
MVDIADGTMKTLTLIRHAKSSWDDPTVSDKERPLNRRGMHDAPRMGQKLAERKSNPELVLSSPATRAITTAHIIAEQVGYPVKDIIVLEGLYEATAIDLRKIVQGLEDSLREVFIFGHNPGLSELASELSNGVVTDLPTCGVAELRFDIKKWSHVDKTRLVKVKVDKPKAE